MGEVIRPLDPLNPQVAARLAGGLRKLAPLRRPAARALMRGEMQAIHGLAGISPNLFEITSKMLDRIIRRVVCA